MVTLAQGLMGLGQVRVSWGLEPLLDILGGCGGPLDYFAHFSVTFSNLQVFVKWAYDAPPNPRS